MTQNELKEMILELLDCGELNSWESDFINDLADIEGSLSEKQKEKLIEIYNEYF